MGVWTWMALLGAGLVAGATLYIRVRWRRAPQAYHAMIALGACFFIAGAVLGAWMLRLAASRGLEVVARPSVPAPSQLAVAFPAVTAGAQPDYLPNKYTGKVVRITDGDTVDVALDPGGVIQSVRLAGIDAPESAQTFGAESTRHLSELISGRAVSLQCEHELSYGRIICKVLLQTGEDACLDQVKAGMAWHYKQYQDEQSPTDRAAYAAAECAAMKARLGFWSGAHPVQPQDFRHGTKSPLLYDPNGCRISSEPVSGAVVGNSRSHIFEWPGCPYYGSISPESQVPFASPQAAEAAGYSPAHNCP